LPYSIDLMYRPHNSVSIVKSSWIWFFFCVDTSYNQRLITRTCLKLPGDNSQPLVSDLSQGSIGGFRTPDVSGQSVLWNLAHKQPACVADRKHGNERNSTAYKPDTDAAERFVLTTDVGAVCVYYVFGKR